MTVKQQLKKRELYDKKGKFKGYKGQVTFTPNPNICRYIKREKMCY
jgi:hypothetical protein